MKAAVYVRVSTEEQENNGTSLDSQQEACLKKAQELGYEVPPELIFKESYSGLTVDRPQLNSLRGLVDNNDFKAVIVYSPDRLSREGETILSLAKEFKLKGLKLICVNSQWDDTLTGKVIAFMLGWASELEAAQIKERTMRGKRTLANRGIIPQGTGPGIFGYEWDKENKKRRVLDFEARVVEKVFNLVAEGNSLNGTARVLNENGISTKTGKKWLPQGIKQMVTNPVYTGKTYYGMTRRVNRKIEKLPEDEWILLPTATPAIISDDLYNRVQKALERSRELRPGRPKNDYLLTGYIKCGYCGSPLIGTCLNHKYRYYHCKATYPTPAKPATCKARYVRANDVEELVWAKVKEVIEHPDLILAELTKRSNPNDNRSNEAVKKQIVTLKKKIQSYEAQEKQLVKLFSLGKIDENIILDQMNELKVFKEEDQSRLSNLINTKAQIVDVEKVGAMLEQYCQRVSDNLTICDLKTKRLALEALDIQVLVTDDQIDVRTSVPLELGDINTNVVLLSGKAKRLLQAVRA